MLGAALLAAGGFWEKFSRAVRQLLDETVGAFFAVFAVVGAAGVWREWRHGTDALPLGVAAGFTVLMTALAVVSFRSARRIR